MIIGTCRIELDLPGIHSLKQKRRCIKSLKARLHKEFNVSVAEVDLHDVWQSSTMGVAVVSNASHHAEAVLNNLVSWIEQYRPDVMVVDWDVEITHF